MFACRHARSGFFRACRTLSPISKPGALSGLPSSRYNSTESRVPIIQYMRPHMRTPRAKEHVPRTEDNQLSAAKTDLDREGGDLQPATFKILTRGEDWNSTFNAYFLRDSCTCPACVDPSSRQRLFKTSDIPPNISAKNYSLIGPEKDKSLRIEWAQDVPGYGPNHVTHLRTKWLREKWRKRRGKAIEKWTERRKFWDRAAFEAEQPWFDYKTYMSQDKTLFEALTALCKYGLLFIRGIPDDVSAVERIAGRIGTLKDTFYGRTWDVQSKPDAKNIAYTKGFLGFHMDLLYVDQPPYLQFLHSLRARAPGGASMFVDSYHAASQLSPKTIGQLQSHQVTYEYRNDGEHYYKRRHVLEFKDNSDADANSPGKPNLIQRVNWSPPFQGSAQSGAITHSKLMALKEFDAAIQRPEAVFEHRLVEGECAVFDNRRVLHARREFDPAGGERWLRGAYIDEDVFNSRHRVLQEEIEGEWMIEGVTLKEKAT